MSLYIVVFHLADLYLCLSVYVRDNIIYMYILKVQQGSEVLIFK